MRSPWFALADGLSHIATILTSMDDEMFVRQGARSSASASRQVAGCLRRVGALREAIRTRHVAAEGAEQPGQAARNCAMAIDAVRSTIWIVLGLEGTPLDLPIVVTCTFDQQSGTLTVGSSVGRELALLVEHVERSRAAIAGSMQAVGQRRARAVVPQLVGRAS